MRAKEVSAYKLVHGTIHNSIADVIGYALFRLEYLFLMKYNRT